MLKEYAAQNNCYYMFLLVCDSLSRFIVCKLINTASREVVSQSFSDILNFYESKRVIVNLRSDLGSEFKSKFTQNMLINRNINYIFSESQNKANFAESAIKHFKRFTFSYMKSKYIQKWVDKFRKIVQI